ncbi:MAG TPA: hypothetical protein VEJ63_18900 [Planctomycetota bacterium]|nr:hypothetical protein [Planctomycetota bacterium]
MSLNFRTFSVLIAALAVFPLAAEESDPPRTVAEPVPPPEEAPAPTKVEKKKPAPAEPKAEAATGEVIAEEVDLISDRPDAATKDAKKPELLDHITTAEPLNEPAGKAYDLIYEMKVNLDKIAKDLDDGGKEVTRLLRTTDVLSKNITDLSKVWPENEKLKDECSGAKRNVLIMNDELARVPRRWTHVRWAFNDSVKEVRKLRLFARDLAEAEPKPVKVVGKDGKVTYVEPEAPPVDPKLVKRIEHVSEVEEAKARLKAANEAKKKKDMPIDLDSR